MKRLNVVRIALILAVVMMFTSFCFEAEAASPKKDITAIIFNVDKKYVGFPTIKLSNTPGVTIGKVTWSCSFAELGRKKAGTKIVASIPVKAKKGFRFLHSTQGYIDGPAGSSVKFYWQNSSNGLIKITVKVHKKLTTPRLTTNKKNVSWSPVESADSYTVAVYDAVSDAKIYSDKLSKKTTKIAFSTILKKISASQAERPIYITLRANGSGNYVTSDTSHRSASFFVKDTSVQATTQKVCYEGKTPQKTCSEGKPSFYLTPSYTFLLVPNDPGSKKSEAITLTQNLDLFQEYEWRFLETGIYLFDGKTFVSGAVSSSKHNWYYFDPTTKKLTVGWIKIGGNYYYANPFTGAFVFKTWIKTSSNNFYYIQANGTMARNKYVDGHYIGADGKWDPNK